MNNGANTISDISMKTGNCRKNTENDFDITQPKSNPIGRCGCCWYP